MPDLQPYPAFPRLNNYPHFWDSFITNIMIFFEFELLLMPDLYPYPVFPPLDKYPHFFTHFHHSISSSNSNVIFLNMIRTSFILHAVFIYESLRLR